MIYKLICLFFVWSTFIFGQAENPYERELINLHQKKFRWMESMQLDSLSDLLADDVYYIHSNGWKESKSEVLENLMTGKLRYDKVTVMESDCRIFGDMAVITGKGIFNVRMQGAPLEIQLYYTEVYSLTGNSPQLVSRHACKIQ